MSTDDITDLSAVELLVQYRTRQLSPVDATRAALQRIETFNESVAALCLVDAESALAAAKASEARWAKQAPCGRLDGIPTTIKDLVLTRGWPTRRGSLAVPADQAWDVDAPAVARLREHGAILLGKTTTPEFGWKCVTDSALTGITRNPWRTDRTPGGSSGGAAVAAALGMGALHLGTDGGGSVRIPAGFTGVFGMKPTFGRVPHFPAAHTGTLFHAGTLTRTVADSALMLSVIAEPDPRDWSSLPADGTDYLMGLDDGIAGLRLAYSPTLGGAKVDPEVAALVEQAVKCLADLGAVIEQVDPGFDSPAHTFATLWYAGAAHLLDGFTPAQRQLVEPGLQAIAGQGARISLPDYLSAQDARADLGRQMSLFHTRYDLLLTPTLPIAAFPAGQELSDPTTQSRWIDWAPFSYPFNLTQQPACSVPCGFTRDGLPVGLQIIGARYAESSVLKTARVYERVHPFVMPAAPID